MSAVPFLMLSSVQAAVRRCVMGLVRISWRVVVHGCVIWVMSCVLVGMSFTLSHSSILT
jgi:hypothetical protein